MQQRYRQYRRKRRRRVSYRQMKGGMILAILLGLAGAHYFFPPSAVPEGTPDFIAAFPNCDAARAAGVTPIFRGHPRWGDHLDADGDGRACEPLPASDQLGQTG